GSGDNRMAGLAILSAAPQGSKNSRSSRTSPGLPARLLFGIQKDAPPRKRGKARETFADAQIALRDADASPRAGRRSTRSAGRSRIPKKEKPRGWRGK